MGITRNDVARLAGVSPATVSYVVNNGPRPVSAETRQRVLRAIEQLGYRPNTIARSLKTRKTYSVGVVISDILNPILASIEKAAEDVLLQQGYSLTICNSDESPDRERILLDMLHDRAMDGIILLPTGSNLNLLLDMLREGRKVVLIDRQIRELETDCVLFDNEAGAYEAVRHLIALGHTQIALLNLPSTLSPGQGRFLGYQKALQDAGLPFLPQLVREGSFKAQEADALVTELLDTQPRPTALLVTSNRLAQAVLREIKARKLRMPDDLALCVFDDVDYYTLFTPSITAVAANASELGTKAAQFLIERINGTYTGEPRTVLIPCQLRIRESSAGPAALGQS